VSGGSGTVQVNQFDTNNNDLYGIQEAAKNWHNTGNGVYLQITVADYSNSDYNKTEIRQVTGLPTYSGGVWTYPTVIIDTYYYGPISSGVEVSISWAFGGAAGYQGRQGPAGTGGGGGGSSTAVDITYAELFSLVGSTGLTGGLYKINDYKTTGWVVGSADRDNQNGFNGATYSAGLGATSFAGPVEPLIVQVINDGSTSWVDPIARQDEYRDDIIHYSISSLGYSDKYFDMAYNNGGTGGAANLPPDWKGHIYYREDTVNKIRGGYDWRNFEFLRWTLRQDPAYVPGDDYFPGDQVSYGGFNYVCIKETLGDALLPLYDYVSPQNVSNAGSDATLAKNYWLRLGPHDYPYISPLLPLYAKDQTWTPVNDIMRYGDTWNLYVGQTDSDYATLSNSSATAVAATITLDQGYLLYTFTSIETDLPDASPTISNRGDSGSYSPNVDLGNYTRPKTVTNDEVDNVRDSRYFTSATDNVFILQAGEHTGVFDTCINNWKFDGLSTSNTVIITPPQAGGTYSVAIFNTASNKLTDFGGNTVWINYNNVIPDGVAWDDAPETSKLFNVFYGNTFRGVIGNLFLDGLVNSDITSLKSSIVESCNTLEIKGDLSLILSDGLFYPGETRNNLEPTSGGSPSDSYTVWLNPFNYVSNNLIRTSKDVRLSLPERLSLTDCYHVSGMMRYSHLSSIRWSQFDNIEYSAFVYNPSDYPSHKYVRILGESKGNYIQSSDKLQVIGEFYNNSLLSISEITVSGRFSSNFFSGYVTRNTIIDMYGCTGIDFGYNNSVFIQNGIDFTASVLQSNEVTKYHFVDYFNNDLKIYYFNNGTMNVTDPNF
jgi:hypothetical protein